MVGLIQKWAGNLFPEKWTEKKKKKEHAFTLFSLTTSVKQQNKAYSTCSTNITVYKGYTQQYRQKVVFYIPSSIKYNTFTHWLLYSAQYSSSTVEKVANKHESRHTYRDHTCNI